MARLRRPWHTLSDQQLYDLLSSSSESDRNSAFEEIYHRHSGRLYAYCLKILGDAAAAQDACQDVFVLFWRAVQPNRIMTNLPAYLLRIARNVALRIKQQQESHPMVSLDEAHITEIEPSTASKSEQAELAQLVSMALELLPSHYREAIVLQCYNGLSYREVADMLNVPLSTARNWIVRAKAQLRKILEPYWYDDPDNDRQTVKHSPLKHHE